MLGKGYGGLWYAPKKGERAKLTRKGDQMEFVDFRLKKSEFVGFRKGNRRQDLPYIAHSWDE